MSQLLADPKSTLASKTLWVNGLTIAVAVLTALSGQADKIPADWMPWIVAAIAAGNFALRFLTNQPVAFFKE